uniref:regulatory factor X-associated protein-like n=1 Tax=Jaculus jaculus TaxID=51337 RepID=UPI001E1B2572|nr:regulatory factor X-associated protein-like [Jaculus jaculus]
MNGQPEQRVNKKVTEPYRSVISHRARLSGRERRGGVAAHARFAWCLSPAPLRLRERRRWGRGLRARRRSLARASVGCGRRPPASPSGAYRSRGRGPRPSPGSTEVRGVAEGSGPGSAGAGAPHPGASVPPAAAAMAPAPASRFTLLVMQPCGAPEETAAGGGPRPAPAPCRPAAYPAEAPGDAEEDDEAELLDTSDPPGGGESAASLEELDDEDAHSGGEGGGRRRGGGACKTCTYEGCSETTSQVAKQRKPWMCKKHRNKMYKDKYKKKKSDQALSCGASAAASSAGSVKLEESTDNLLSIVKQRTGSFGDRPARPTLLEQVLNQKRLSLLRSPEVVQFLQKQQQLLNQQVLEQRQQQFPGAPV